MVVKQLLHDPTIRREVLADLKLAFSGLKGQLMFLIDFICIALFLVGDKEGERVLEHVVLLVTTQYCIDMPIQTFS